MKNNIFIKIIKELIPLFLALVVFIFIKNEWLIALGVLVLLLITFKIRYYKNEYKIFIFGIIIGFIFEVSGDYIYKLQYWESASLFGVPVWLPLLWGYGFIFIRRIGNILLNKDN